MAVAFAKILLAAILMGVAAWTCEHFARAAWPGGDVLGQLIRLLSAIGCGIVTLAFAAKVLRIDEFDQALRLVSTRIGRNRSSAVNHHSRHSVQGLWYDSRAVPRHPYRPTATHTFGPGSDL